MARSVPYERGDVWTRGLTAGVLGGAAVLMWFLVIDMVAGWLLLTAGALGSAIFLGARDPAQVQVTVLTVGGYVALHFLAFAAFGMGASRAVSRARRRPRVLLGAVLLVAVIATLLLALLTILAEVLLGELAWWSVAAGGVLGALALGGYLWAADRELEDAVHRDPFESDRGGMP